MADDGNSRPVRRVVVSGGLGSGKSTVLRTLERLGAVVIEADRIGHEVLEPGGAAYAEVAERWPSVVVDGRIDRARLAAIVFTDEQELDALEAISHPRIAAAIRSRVEAAGDRDVAVELPLSSDLLGSEWTRLVVDAPREVRLARVVARGMSRPDAGNRIKTQLARHREPDAKAIVIDNTGSLADLELKAERIWESL